MDHESALAALLLLGLWTGPVALLAALNSVAIGLSVLHYRNEWPWSCYLMIALHVLLFATEAGDDIGLDGVGRRGDARGYERWWRSEPSAWWSAS